MTLRLSASHKTRAKNEKRRLYRMSGFPFNVLNWFGRAKKKTVKTAMEARAALIVASAALAKTLEDADGNGLPDVAEKVARYAAQIVDALELIHGHASGSGAVKLNDAMAEVLAVSRKGLVVWRIAAPFIEAAVGLLPRKQAEAQ